MIDSNQVMIGIFTGSILIVVGLVPDLFQEAVDAVRASIELFSSGVRTPSHPRDRIRQPRWLALVGAALIALTISAYLSSW